MNRSSLPRCGQAVSTALRVLLAVECLELVPQLAGFGAVGVVQVGRRGGFGAGVGDAVEARPRVAAADGEVHRAVVADDDVGQVQRRLAADCS